LRLRRARVRVRVVSSRVGRVVRMRVRVARGCELRRVVAEGGVGMLIRVVGRMSGGGGGGGGGFRSLRTVVRGVVELVRRRVRLRVVGVVVGVEVGRLMRRGRMLEA
jgi:hypothetical protein